MKIINRLTVSIVAIFAFLYVGHWFYRAQQAKEFVLAHLKNYEKQSSGFYRLETGDVSVQGFPFSYEVKLNKPRYILLQEGKKSLSSPTLGIDGTLKIGTDILGKSYWLKQEGDLKYIAPTSSQASAKEYICKGNREIKLETVHPHYSHAFIHPFAELPKGFNAENFSIYEILRESKRVSYEDHDFVLYEKKGDVQTQWLSFSKGGLRWKQHPNKNKENKFLFSLDIEDAEAANQGKALLEHFKKFMVLNTDGLDIPSFLSSGKNTFNLEFEASLPLHLALWNFLSAENFDITLNKLNIKNPYGQLLVTSKIAHTQEEHDHRNLHLEFRTDSILTPQGIEAIHRQFMEGLKLKASETASSASKRESQLLDELLKCCKDRLEDIIPDYAKLGKKSFIFDADVKIRDVVKKPFLHQIIIHNFDLDTQPYGIKSHGQAEFIESHPQGKYEFEWKNYKQMIHDLVAYFNRIHPVLEKIAEFNKQPLSLSIIDEDKEAKIIDFFRSLANEASQESATLSVTVNFMEKDHVKIGSSSLEQVKEAWEKLKKSLQKPEAPAAEEELPSSIIIPPITEENAPSSIIPQQPSSSLESKEEENALFNHENQPSLPNLEPEAAVPER
ncbi:hypothetical protein NEOC84_000271|uniref:hypothetical protein n=1 Tax=Neochlamydia sp. AcF84 TaxID=2315858 RepID=UPI0014080168|nr:hypothetical protein [Neochlamydia sp. AcF84]NGY94398.1 hypothetical protein [Neochlamydia sp. AcF84]